MNQAHPRLHLHSRPQQILTTLTAAATLVILGGLSQPALAQSQHLVVEQGHSSTAYVVDGNRGIVRNNFGQCVRTGFWTLEGAMATRVKDSPFSAGCACDEPLMPAGHCAAPPPPVALPATTPTLPVPVAPMPTSEKVSIPADALFAFDRSALSPEGQGKLSAFSQQLKGLNLEAVVAVGHTDRIGAPTYNATLSQDRALAVKAFLVSQGIEAERVFVEGRGETEPVTGTACQDVKGRESGKNMALVACLAPDRRVVIEAIGTRR